MGNAQPVSNENIYSQLDCLLNPKRHVTIWDDANFSPNTFGFDKDILNVIDILKKNDKLVYAMIAPAFLGQFCEEVSSGKLRSALKFLGFAGMVEVSLFADILTLKEALEFDRRVQNNSDYMLTSCCCPMWIALLKKQNLLSHLSYSVSPMIACGRAIKIIHPDALTVFIGPCIAKKSEAREKDLVGAVDYVLTFQEAADIFAAMKINLVNMSEDNRDHSSKSGRIYACAGGVSQAIVNTLKRINPDKKIAAKCANGMLECKEMIKELSQKQKCANFFEGMGCIGGCIGGPKKIIDKNVAFVHVKNYSQKAVYETPIDNPYVIKLLEMLGFETVESLLDDNKIFTRHFG